MADLYDLLGDPDEMSAQEKARAYAQALRRDQGASLLAQVSGNKLLEPVARSLSQSAAQGQENLQQVGQFRLQRAAQAQRQAEEQRRYQAEQAYRQQRDTVEDSFKRQQLARQPQGPAPIQMVGQDGRPYLIDPRTRQALPVTTQDGQPFAGQKPGRAQDPAKLADDLRNEFQKQPVFKATSDMADAIAKIRTAPEDGTGDLSLIYSFVKILDPGSVVREGEIKLSREPTPMLAQLVQAYSKAARGDLLHPTLRAQYKNSAEQLWKAQFGRYEQTAGQYRKLAEDAGADPGRVILESFSAGPQVSAEDQAAAEWLKANPDHPKAAAVAAKLKAKGP